MHLRNVVGNLGNLVRLFSASFLLPAGVALAYEAGGPTWGVGGLQVPANAALFLALFLFSLALGIFLRSLMGSEDFREAEAFVMVGLGYLLLAGLAALPYLLTGAIPGPIDAYFEGMSGIATVGATVMSYPLEAHPPSVLFWRALTQWIGGMGIIVLGVALLPKLVESGADLMRAEFSAGGVRLKPKLAETARNLWAIYVLITALGAGALLLVLWGRGMAPEAAAYEAITHAFTSVATAGFSTHTASIAHFQDPVVELILAVLMIVGATSFVLHFRALHGAGLQAYKDEEFLFFGGLLVVVTLGVAGILTLLATPAAWATMGGAPDALQALRHSFFNVVSILTTTGYASADYDAWPEAARLLLILLMVTGGMAGSTAGGIKTMRILVLLKLLQRESLRILHPRAVLNVRFRGALVDERALDNIAAFFFAFLTVVLGSTIVLTMTGLDMVAAFVSSAATVSTLGPALGNLVGGPDFTYAAVHPVGKLVLTFNMWFGRLEIFAALLVLLPRTYRR